jgi:hypothetical protein
MTQLEICTRCSSKINNKVNEETKKTCSVGTNEFWNEYNKGIQKYRTVCWDVSDDDNDIFFCKQCLLAAIREIEDMTKQLCGEV